MKRLIRFRDLSYESLVATVNRQLTSAFTRNTVWMFLGQGLRLVIQAVYFALIARSLGTHNYGAFIGVVALVGIAYPFGTLGSGNLLVKNVSRDKRVFALYWGRALLVTATSSSILFATVVLLSHFLLPSTIPIKLVLLVAGSDLLGLNIIMMCGQAFQAFERLNWTAAIHVMISASRLGGAIALVQVHRHSSALQWGYLYCCTTAIVVIAAFLLVWTKVGHPEFSGGRGYASELREGLYFSAGLSAQTVYNDIDKIMLARLGTLEATGIYGAAYRLIDVSFAPVSSLIYAAYPTFFRKGAKGIEGGMQYAGHLFFMVLPYSIVVFVGVLMSAGLVPRFLSGEYSKTVDALRWLAFLPVLKTAHYFIADSLSGAGYQSVRAAIQISVAVFNILVNLWLIPVYSWRGATWSSLASDGLLAASFWIAAIELRRRERVAMQGTRRTGAIRYADIS